MPQHDNDIPDFVREVMHKAITAQMPTTEQLKQMAQPERKAHPMEPKKQTPSIGWVVHYISHGSPDGTHAALQHRAAIITEVYHNPTRENEDNLSTNVGLCVLNPNGMYFQRHTPYDATGMQPGTWHWPEYVA